MRESDASSVAFQEVGWPSSYSWLIWISLPEMAAGRSASAGRSRIPQGKALFSASPPSRRRMAHSSLLNTERDADLAGDTLRVAVAIMSGSLDEQCRHTESHRYEIS